MSEITNDRAPVRGVDDAAGRADGAVGPVDGAPGRVDGAAVAALGAAAIWVNGRLRPVEDATVSAFDHGLTVGDGVFETIKVTGGMPFALTRHLDRLVSSARGLQLPPPDLEVVRAAVDETVAATTMATARLRITYTGGVSPLGSDRGTSGPTMIVAVAPLASREPTAAVVTVPWPRNERGALAGLKTTSYAENVVALAYARERGATEAICADTTGRLCEGTGSNVFLVVDGELITPSLATGCLAGVTRSLVLEWCGASESDVPLDALFSASEVFLTSTTRDIQPVRRVDDGVLAAPGPRTAAAIEVFARHAAENLDP